MLVLINNPIPEIEAVFLLKALGLDDDLLVADNARYLALQPNALTVNGYIRENDFKLLGSACHDDWKVITDQEWLKLTVKNDKTISW
jgi:sulfur transfer complex TusBCD TusB component (DsrH family)